MISSKEMETQSYRIAAEYDAGQRKFIPCFSEFYGDTMDFVAGSMNTPPRILDLGARTCAMTMYHWCHFSQAEYLLTDIASSLLEYTSEICTQRKISAGQLAGASKVQCLY